jgi:glycosyltransferase involved in cell wall biosynthesis
VRVIYVSYDGALDPLGTSQVVRYLVRLAGRGVDFSLISFEKPARWADEPARLALARRLEAAGIRWIPQRYHKRPRVPATLWDCLRGLRALAGELRRKPAEIVHCRGDVAMLIARGLGERTPARLLYDVRSFFAAERAESGSWDPGGLLDRAVRSAEAGNRQRADGIVVVSEAARHMLAELLPAAEIRVIPGCADLSLFRPRGRDEAAEFGLVYSGSLGSWYMTEEMVAFARRASVSLGRTLFLTPDAGAARKAGAAPDWSEVRSSAPDDVPGLLRRARASFFFIRPTLAKRSSFPVKLAESLACGLPVVANRGVGDLDNLIETERVGVFVKGFSPVHYSEAVESLARLLMDPETPDRCRRLAESRYGLEAGVEAYHRFYRHLVARGEPA